METSADDSDVVVVLDGPEGDTHIAARKRVRSDSTGENTLTDQPDSDRIPKKSSLDVGVSFPNQDRVALLDAGAQYGKVCHLWIH